MKVYLSVRAIMEDYDMPGLEMYVFPTKEEASRESDTAFELTLKQLPKYNVYFKHPPLNHRGFKKWVEKNKTWANKVAPHIGSVGF